MMRRALRRITADMTTSISTTKMTNTTLSLCMILLLTIMSVTQATESSLTFNLPYGQRKCFMEDLSPNGLVRGTVDISSGRGEMKLDMFVSDSRGTVHFHKSDVTSVKFSFNLPNQPHNDGRSETYRFCIVNQIHPQSALSNDAIARKVTLKIAYVSNEHKQMLSNLARSDHAEKLFSTFSSVSADVDQLIRALDELRIKEDELTSLNQTTAKTILFISLVACLFTILTGVLSFFSLKSFFKRKKLA